MTMFQKLILSVFIALFAISNTYAETNDACFNKNASKEKRGKYTSEKIKDLRAKFPEIDFGSLDFPIVSKDQMEKEENAGETHIEIQRKQEKRVWSDGRVEILKEWEDINVPRIKFNGDKEMPESWIEYVWVHENAHVIYYRHLSKDQREKWEKISSQYKSSVTPYGESDPKEDFAEWFTFYFYPWVFANKECFLQEPLNMASEKNKFMEEVRKNLQSRLGWLPQPRIFVENMKRNPNQKNDPSISEQIARDNYRKQNGIYYASAPKEEITSSIPQTEIKTPKKTTTREEKTREVPSFVKNHIQKRKDSIRKEYLINARNLEPESEIESYLKFIKDRRTNK